MRTFEFSEGSSNKFWHIELAGSAYTVTFGRIGTKGQTQTKSFPSADAARKAHDKLVAEKLGKGYAETTPKSAPPPAAPVSALQRSLEDAIAENPDDLASHSAYADYLMEQGDPRGEFIQTQLALEDPKRRAKQRKQLQGREAELRELHARQWLGDVGRLLVGDWSGPDKPWRYRFARGWPDTLRLLPFHKVIFDMVARLPEFRLLRQLEIVYDMQYHPFDFGPFLDGPNSGLREDEEDEMADEDDTWDTPPVLPAFVASPHLGNLRVFRMGFSDDREHLCHSTMINVFEGEKAADVIALLGKCPRLDELYLNTRLQDIAALFAAPALGQVTVLQYYFGSSHRGNRSTPAYPLTALASNRKLGRLTTLRLHPGRDAAIDLDQFDALLRSKNLPALRCLQVHMGTFGDEGVGRLVASKMLDRLETLDIGYGNLTDEGASVLAKALGRKNLKSLDVSRNALTNAGIDELKNVVPHVAAAEQHAGDEMDFRYEVDVE